MEKTKTSLKDKIVEIFGLDIRSLALFRVAMALVTLFDLAERLCNLTAFYTDQGVFPRSMAIAGSSDAMRMSLHLMNGEWWAQALLFALEAVFIFLLLIGYKTRLSTFIVWILTVSLNGRNRMVISSADVLHQALLFWSLFLPWGRYFSVDSALQRRYRNPSFTPVLNAGTIALLCQFALLYMTSVVYKVSGVSRTYWWDQGTAVAIVLGIGTFAKPLAQWLKTLPMQFLQSLNYAILFIEAIGPLFLIFPLRNGLIRTLTVFLFILLQVGFGLALALGIFPFVGILAALPFLPAWFWEKLGGLFPKKALPEIQVFYDGSKGFGQKAARIVQTFLMISSVSFHPMRAEDRGALPEKGRLWVVFSKSGPKFGFDAFWELLMHSPFSFCPRFCPVFIPVFKTLYGATLFLRKLFLHWTGHLMISREYREMHPLKQMGVLFCLWVVMTWNFEGISFKRFVPEPIRPVVYALQLDQSWLMFSPPQYLSGWFVIPGKLSSGKVVDVHRGGQPVSWDRPGQIYKTYQDSRWRKYLSNYLNPAYAEYRRYYANYLCHQWNQTRKDKLEEFEVFFVTQEDSSLQSLPVNKTSYWRHFCFNVPSVIPPFEFEGAPPSASTEI